jgi:hypothetical protein
MIVIVVMHDAWLRMLRMGTTAELLLSWRIWKRGVGAQEVLVFLALDSWGHIPGQ